MFPGDEKDHIRAQLAESLLGVIWQDLIKKEDGSRIPATEVMIKSTGIENMIRENHIHQIIHPIGRDKRRYSESFWRLVVVRPRHHPNLPPLDPHQDLICARLPS